MCGSKDVKITHSHFIESDSTFRSLLMKKRLYASWQSETLQFHSITLGITLSTQVTVAAAIATRMTTVMLVCIVIKTGRSLAAAAQQGMAGITVPT